MTPRQADVLTALGLAGLLAVIALTAPRWAASLRAPAQAIEGEEPSPEPAGAPLQARAGRRINVRLYFESTELGALASEVRAVALAADLAVQLRTVVLELAKGPTTPGLAACLPQGTQVRNVFVHRGVAYVNLSSQAKAGLGGSRAELLTVYSLVNTIVSNFPAAGRVQILIDDEVVPSLAGHVDLSRPVAPDMTLLASGAATASSPGSGSLPASSR